MPTEVEGQGAFIADLRFPSSSPEISPSDVLPHGEILQKPLWYHLAGCWSF